MHYVMYNFENGCRVSWPAEVVSLPLLSLTSYHRPAQLSAQLCLLRRKTWTIGRYILIFCRFFSFLFFHKPRGGHRCKVVALSFQFALSLCIYVRKDRVSARIFKFAICFVLPAFFWSNFTAGFAYCCLLLSFQFYSRWCCSRLCGKLTYQV